MVKFNPTKRFLGAQIINDGEGHPSSVDVFEAAVDVSYGPTGLNGKYIAFVSIGITPEDTFIPPFTKVIEVECNDLMTIRQEAQSITDAVSNFFIQINS